MANDTLISCDGLSRSHGTRELFTDLSFGVADGDRVGLIGPNGSGKSTLLRILAGREDPDAGTVSRRRGLRCGFVEQSPEIAADLTCEQAVSAPLEALGMEDHEALGRVASALGRAGFMDFSQRVGTLSGGRLKRLAIARELALEPDLLLLDEPTNHLDLEGILWLEELLGYERFACIIVTHDRWFLQDTVTRTMELDRAWQGGFFAVRGSYADFLEKREEAAAGQRAAQASLANVVRREVEWLRRGPKARTTKSEARIKEAERLQAELAASRQRTATRSAGIDFSATDRKSRRLLVAHGVAATIADRTVLQPFDLALVAGMRLGVIGRNGSGKTTFLRLLAADLLPSEGRIDRAPGLAVIRFEQDRSSLDPELSLHRALAPEGDAVTFQGQRIHVSSWARRFLFRQDQLPVAVGRLSGGEQARVLVARLMLTPADVLLLDEPTNDLDIATLEILEESLVEFPGALVLVTHDRFMLDRVSTTLLAVEDDGSLTAFADLAQWQSARRGPAAPLAASPARSSGDRPREARSGLKALSNKERREWEAMEARILEAEGTLERCKVAAADPAIASDAVALHARHDELETARREVDRLYARWAELEARKAGG